VLAGCALAATAMNAIGQFLAQFLLRSFHVAPSRLSFLLSVIAVASMAAGLLLGGFGVDRAARRDQRWYVWGPALTLMIAAPAFVLGFNQSTIPATVAVLMVGHVALFVYFTPTLAIAQNMVGANMRASSAFVVSLTIGLVGIGLGPTLTGFLSDAFAQRAFTSGDYLLMCPDGAPAAGSAAALTHACLDASTTGLRQALMAMSLLLVWAALHYLLAARAFRRDLETQFEPVRP
jgi:MFS family permease